MFSLRAFSGSEFVSKISPAAGFTENRLYPAVVWVLLNTSLLLTCQMRKELIKGVYSLESLSFALFLLSPCRYVSFDHFTDLDRKL